MTNNSKTSNRPSWLLLIFPPLVFLLKDVIATFIVLSYEPGVTEKAVNNYALQLLPATLFVETGRAIPLNVGFGLLLGGFLYLDACVDLRNFHEEVNEVKPK